MHHLFWIALGGALGAVSRYALSETVQKLAGAGFAWGTLSVNLLGCLLMGLAYHLAATTAVPANLRFLVTVGFLGAFTTFSTFGQETANFLRDGAFTTAGLYVLASNIIGVGMVFLGLWVGHRIHEAMK
jgi:CrcB protein